jgi:phosphatidylglycerol---prolipoprotein diacylglyceryl transferase
MHPVLFTIGGHIVETHNFFIALGLAVGAVLFTIEARRHGAVSEQMLWIVAGALIGGAIGAKLTAILGQIGAPSTRPMSSVIIDGGRSIIGGLTGGYIGVVLMKKIVRYDQPTGDLFAPGAAAGMAVGRLGCFFSELPGTPTTLPWGIRLDPSQFTRIPNCPAYCRTSALHPSFAYEILFLALMFVILWTRLRHRASLRGELFKIFLLCYAVFRFAVEFVRGNEVFWHGLTRHQVYLIPAALLLAAYFVRRRSRFGNLAYSEATP